MAKLQRLNKIWQLVSVVFLVLFLTVGMLFTFHYSGPIGNAYVNNYSFAADNAKRTDYLDYESALLLEQGKTETSDYAGKLLISNERINRTGTSQTWAVLLTFLMGGLVALIFIDLALSLIKMSQFYYLRFNLFQLVIKICEATISLLILIGSKIYLAAIGEAAAHFSVGFGVYLLVGLAIAQIILWAVVYFIYKKQNDVYNLNEDNSIGYLTIKKK